MAFTLPAVKGATKLDHPTFAVKTKKHKKEISQDERNLPRSLRGSKGSHCLSVACSEGDLETVRLLTEDPRITFDMKRNEITAAAYLGDEEVVRILARSPRYAITQEALTSALMSATKSGALAVVDFLLREITQFLPKTSEVLTTAITTRHFEVVEKLLQDPPN